MEKVKSRHLAVNVRHWHSLQRGSEMMNAMEHPISCCDRRLDEVLMPKLCCVQDHQQAAALEYHVLATVVLKGDACTRSIFALKLPRQALFWLDVGNDTDAKWAQ